MLRRFVPLLLVLGWLSFSGIDVIEDLGEIPSQSAVSTAPNDLPPRSEQDGWGHLANNMIESASRSKQIGIVLLALAPIVFYIEPVTEFRKHSQIHKLHRVFLI
jgi:hypothetical protein